MGHQFSFFLGPEDIEPFQNSLAASVGIKFLYSRPTTPEPKILKGLSSDSRTLLVRETDLAEINFQPVPQQKFFDVDTYSNNVIECDIITMPHEGLLPEGRLYYHSSYWNPEGQKVQKAEAFHKWSQSLFRRVKKSLTYIDYWFYAGDHALRMRSEGIRFNQLDGGPTPSGNLLVSQAGTKLK